RPERRRSTVSSPRVPRDAWYRGALYQPPKIKETCAKWAQVTRLYLCRPLGKGKLVHPWQASQGSLLPGRYMYRCGRLVQKCAPGGRGLAGTPRACTSTLPTHAAEGAAIRRAEREIAHMGPEKSRVR